MLQEKLPPPVVQDSLEESPEEPAKDSPEEPPKESPEEAPTDPEAQETQVVVEKYALIPERDLRSKFLLRMEQLEKEAREQEKLEQLEKERKIMEVRTCTILF